MSTKPPTRCRSRSEVPHHVQVCCQRTPISAFRWLFSRTSAARCLGPSSPSSTPTQTRAARRRSRTSHTGSQNTPTPQRGQWDLDVDCVKVYKDTEAVRQLSRTNAASACIMSPPSAVDKIRTHSLGCIVEASAIVMALLSMSKATGGCASVSLPVVREWSWSILDCDAPA